MLKQPERAWDRYDAYLFDIDGTLLHCKDAVHYFAFCDTLHMLSGRPLNLDGVTAHGNTDVGIVRDALQLAGVADDVWRPRLAEARDRMCCYVEQHKDELQVDVLPCVRQVLTYLQVSGAVLGVATGNLKTIGQLKLANCGLLERFAFGGYSDAHEARRDVFAAALQQARALAGGGASVCVVGDTPADVQAAHANHLDVIAIATGVYAFEQLQVEQPEFCLHSFCELAL